MKFFLAIAELIAGILLFFFLFFFQMCYTVLFLLLFLIFSKVKGTNINWSVENTVFGIDNHMLINKVDFFFQKNKRKTHLKGA